MICSSFHDFGMRYCAGHQTPYGWNFSGSGNLKELEALLKHCCLIRRLKTEVLKQLPSKIRYKYLNEYLKIIFWHHKWIFINFTFALWDCRQKVLLDPHLIKAATKEMKEASKKLEKSSMNGAMKHNALLEYYNETSKAKEKAVW